MVPITLIPLFATMAPFLIWPIELFLPYPFIIEELAKLILVFPILKLNNRKNELKLALVVGILFSISESVLYLFNISLVGDITTLFIRLALTIPLHVVTTLIILVPPIYNRKLLLPALIVAMLVHFIFNLVV